MLHRRWSRLTDHDRVLPYLRASAVNGCRMVHRRRSIVSRIIGDRRSADAVLVGVVPLSRMSSRNVRTGSSGRSGRRGSRPWPSAWDVLPRRRGGR
ncbi:hypothetical protein DKM19_39470 [Streptosporangium sp. 'caverna']|nr:hypothetical protein DKM19_39470 [Streptosporangium sp. 'caverna']